MHKEYAACYFTEPGKGFILSEFSSEEIKFYIDEIGAPWIEDIFYDLPKDLVGPYWWEGNINYNEFGGYDTPIEFEPEFDGKWRKPTKDEWLSWGNY